MTEAECREMIAVHWAACLKGRRWFVGVIVASAAAIVISAIGTAYASSRRTETIRLDIAGRMAAYTGKTLTWDECFNSQLDLTPPAYEWGPLETPQVAIPGVTKFV